MYGSLIGLVPKHFIIVLIENHYWYEHGTTNMGGEIDLAYNTARKRQSGYEVPVMPVVVNPSGPLPDDLAYRPNEMNKSIQEPAGEEDAPNGGAEKK